MNRRRFLHAGTGSLAALGALAGEGLSGPNPRQRLGVVVYSYGIRRGADPKGPLQDPLGFIEHCRKIGAGGVQIGLGSRDADYAARLRQRVEAAGMYVEGMVRLPTEPRDVEGFEREVATARACGATVVRAALLSGRRYEVFKSAQEFRDFRERSRRALALARPIVEKHKLRLAIENHKDWRSAELIELLREVKSPHLGACVDTGNSIA